jgi:uncharacterized OB-fold protein
MAQVPVPVPDDITAEFWAAARQGVLKVQRCADCGSYQQPPGAACRHCASADLTFERVSGRGTVYAYTETRSGARHPAFAAKVPYLVGLVELAEQRGLLMHTNFPGATLEALRTGVPVTVEFEQLTDEIWIPQFRLATAPGQGNPPRQGSGPAPGEGPRD